MCAYESIVRVQRFVASESGYQCLHCYCISVGWARAIWGLSEVNGVLARKLRFTDYFALAFGTMVGVGWLVVMDDWLGRGGPLGAILGFAIRGGLLLPVGHVYRRDV